ncbi:phosphatase PAP2 family protein [Arenibacter certesii]|uniref:Phosphatase PAP2 family protein n=1 Tax=Arenibacter certesii TaxID=228955 RepID=A0A918IQI9_9FLAO|nr:phosphatase PAP2 family protein [Arenibacter certesii]GGW26712.1 phosphatase PAP2 family protein [Arenibacter certesii]
MLEELVKYDKELFLFLNHLGTSQWDGFWLFITSKWSAIPLYLFLAFLTYKSFGIKQLLLVMASIAVLILATDQLANFFKYGVGRLRPCFDLEIGESVRLVKASCGGQFGYFSAHAGNSFAVATFFILLLRTNYSALGLILVVWAMVVAYSRIYIGVHFPLDIFTGAVIGSGMASLFYHLFIRIRDKYNL